MCHIISHRAGNRCHFGDGSQYRWSAFAYTIIETHTIQLLTRCDYHMNWLGSHDCIIDTRYNPNNSCPNLSRPTHERPIFCALKSKPNSFHLIYAVSRKYKIVSVITPGNNYSHMKYACFLARASFENCFCHRSDYILSFDASYTSFRVPFDESDTPFRAPYVPCAVFYGLSAVCAPYMSCVHCVITQSC